MTLWLAALGAGLVVVGVTLVSTSGRTLLSVYHIVADEPVPVADLPAREGPVEVRGTVRPEGGQTVHAPLTESDALAYEYEIRARRSDTWETIETGHDAVSFLLVDDDAVQVRPTGAELRLDGYSEQIPAGEALPDALAQQLDDAGPLGGQQGRLGLQAVERDTSTERTVIERRLDPGVSVRVYGQVEGAPTAGDERVPARIAEGAASPLVIAATPDSDTAREVIRRPLFRLAVGLLALVAGSWALLSGLGLL